MDNIYNNIKINRDTIFNNHFKTNLYNNIISKVNMYKNNQINMDNLINNYHINIRKIKLYNSMTIF